MLAITILGNNSAVPAFNRHPTAQVVQTAENSFLIDCGEGTQMRMINIDPQQLDQSYFYFTPSW